jgi:hypothetical protein
MGSLAGWVPVFVPAEIAPEVLQRVAEFVQTDGSPGSPSDWSNATSEDLDVFFREIPDIEWRLVTQLAEYDRPAAVPEVAQSLGVEVGAVAGAIGPINKRAKREGWAPPIQPARFIPEGSRSSRRGLLLPAEIRSWVRSRNGENAPR